MKAFLWNRINHFTCYFYFTMGYSLCIHTLFCAHTLVTTTIYTHYKIQLCLTN